MPNRWWPTLALVVALALLVTGAWWWQSWHRTELQRAMSWAPSDGQRFTFTDWSGVRRELDADLAPDSSSRDVERFMDEAFQADLSSMSALPESTATLQDRFGFSPATLDWELFSQSDAGAAVLMRLPEGTDFTSVTDRLEELGYQRPDDEDGVWVGGVDLLPRIGTLTPELQFLAVDPGQRLVVGSDTQEYLERALPDITGGDGGVSSVENVVEASGEPLAAAIYDGDVACSRLAMGNASASDQREADDLLAAAGEVNPMTAFAMSAQPGGDIRVAMGFEDQDQARTNADTRARLAKGPAPGQGGDFSDRFDLGPVTADNGVVTMRLTPTEGSYVLSDLTSGPVLFATC